MTVTDEIRALFRVLPRSNAERLITPVSLGFKAWLRRAHREGLITGVEMDCYEVRLFTLTSVEEEVRGESDD